MNENSKNDDCRPGDATHARFPAQTHWTEIVGPAAGSDTKAQDALNRLCQIYWFPLYAFIRRQGNGPEDAGDLAQSFFAHLIHGNRIKEASREKGKFRTFLIGCLKNFLVDKDRHAGAAKRGGKTLTISIDDAEAEERYKQLPANPPAPEVLYDRIWAATVMNEALNRLRQEFADQGRLDLFGAMEPSLRGELSPESYPEVSAKLGILPGTFQTNLSRFKPRLLTLVREVISSTVDRAQIEDELLYLKTAWVAGLQEGR